MPPVPQIKSDSTLIKSEFKASTLIKAQWMLCNSNSFGLICMCNKTGFVLIPHEAAINWTKSNYGSICYLVLYFFIFKFIFILLFICKCNLVRSQKPNENCTNYKLSRWKKFWIKVNRDLYEWKTFVHFPSPPFWAHGHMALSQLSQGRGRVTPWTSR